LTRESALGIFAQYRLLRTLCVDSIIIAGAGAAGLSLAYYLAGLDSSHEFSCTLIDPDDKTDYDRTWSYWGEPFEFDDLVEREWRTLRLHNDGLTAAATLDAPAYRFIRSDRFYGRCREVITADPRFTFVRGRVETVEADGAGVTVGVREHGAFASEEGTGGPGLARYRGDYLVESAFGPGGEPAFRQSFVGWHVEGEAAVWDAEEATLMDFEGPSRDAGARPGGGLEFAYILPVDERHALVEFTTVTAVQPEDDYLETRLERYLDRTLGAQRWVVTHREKGSIPLYDSRGPSSTAGGRVIHLGVTAGAARPTTGYAFRSIVETSRAVAADYGRRGVLRAPSAIGGDAMPAHRGARPRFYDRVFLEVLAGEPEALPRALVQLFRRGRTARVFRFLAGRSNLRDELGIIMSLPWGPFLRALWRTATPGRRRAGLDTPLRAGSTQA
jgi:lycopene beta-cyclase